MLGRGAESRKRRLSQPAEGVLQTQVLPTVTVKGEKKAAQQQRSRGSPFPGDTGVGGRQVREAGAAVARPHPCLPKFRAWSVGTCPRTQPHSNPTYLGALAVSSRCADPW